MSIVNVEYLEEREDWASIEHTAYTVNPEDFLQKSQKVYLAESHELKSKIQ